MVIINSSIAHRRRFDLEGLAKGGVGILVLEVGIKNEKCFFIGIYKPPGVTNESLIDTCHILVDAAGNRIRSTYFLGDINIDMM